MALYVRKKAFYYALGILAVVALAFLGPLCYLDNNESLSVAAAIARLPRERQLSYSSERAFDACATGWMYVLLAVIAALPSASSVYEELASRFYMGVEQRMGKCRYVCSRLLYAAASGGALSAAGLGAYALAVSCIFPLSPVSLGGQGTYVDGAMAASFLLSIGSQILYMASYGMAMSMLAALLVFLYPDLYTCLGILFILGYLLKDAAMVESMALPWGMAFPWGVAAASAAACGALWKVKGGRA